MDDNDSVDWNHLQFFHKAFVLKKISALVSPSGQEGLVPVQVFSCGNCGQVAEGFLDENVLDEEK